VWPPLTLWLGPDVDDRLIATALNMLEEEVESHG
jgi:hypothetical protein